MHEFEIVTLARIVHVLAVIIWIGGVGLVTLVLIPAIQKLKSKNEQITTFEQIERRFASIAKIMTLLTALTGFYMLFELNAWDRYLEVRYWWIHAMTLIWVIFTVVLFILEPLVLHQLFHKYAEKNPERTFKTLHKLHVILLILSLITTAGAVAGSHGWFWIR